MHLFPEQADIIPSGLNRSVAILNLDLSIPCKVIIKLNENYTVAAI